MRWSRLVIVSGVVVIALLGAGWRFAVVGHPALAARPVAQSRLQVPAVLRKQLAALAARTFRVPRALRVPRTPIPPGGLPRVPSGPCYIAIGECSLTPCVEFAHGASPAVSTSSSAVVLRLVSPVTQLASPLTGRGAALPATPSCQGRLGTPRVLRVSGP